jgi:hypothetical protein
MSKDALERRAGLACRAWYVLEGETHGFGKELPVVRIVSSRAVKQGVRR